MAGVLQRSAKPVLLAANKVDDANREVDAWDFTRLGLGDPMGISALHGRRSGELLDAIVDALPEPEERRGDAGRDGRRGRGRRGGAVLGGHRGPAQRGQVDPLQPVGGRGARRGPRRPGDHPRHHRYGGGHGRAACCVSSTRLGCGARAVSTRAPSTTGWCGPCRPSTRPTAPSWSSTPPRASPIRTSAWPSASTPPAAPPYRAQQVGPPRRRRPGGRPGPGGRPPRLPGLRPGTQDLGPHRAQRDSAAARAVPGPGRVPPAGAHPGAQPGAGRGPGRPILRPRSGATGPGCCTPPRALPTRPPSPSSPPGSCRRSTCATWSARSGRRSPSVRRRSSSGSVAGGNSSTPRRSRRARLAARREGARGTADSQPGSVRRSFGFGPWAWRGRWRGPCAAGRVRPGRRPPSPAVRRRRPGRGACGWRSRSCPAGRRAGGWASRWPPRPLGGVLGRVVVVWVSHGGQGGPTGGPPGCVEGQRVRGRAGEGCHRGAGELSWRPEREGRGWPPWCW